jgi:hypothetical protein
MLSCTQVKEQLRGPASLLLEEVGTVRAEAEMAQESLRAAQDRYLRLTADFDNYRKRTVSLSQAPCTDVLLVHISSTMLSPSLTLSSCCSQHARAIANEAPLLQSVWVDITACIWTPMCHLICQQRHADMP